MRINSLHDALSFFPDIDGFWHSNDLPATETRIQSLVEEAKDQGKYTKLSELLTQLSRAQALQGKLDEARVSLEKAHEVLIKDGTDMRIEIRWLLEHGRVLSLSMSPIKAHELFAKAWKLADEIAQPYFAIDAALMLSSIRPPREQNEWLKKALKIAESAVDESARRWLPHLRFLQGWHAFDLHQFAEALNSFDRALERLPADSYWESALQWSRARTLRALDRVPEALTVQESLLKKAMAENLVNGYVYLEIAECKQALNVNSDAKAYFELAHAKLSTDRWFSDNKSNELERMKYLSKKN